MKPGVQCHYNLQCCRPTGSMVKVQN